MVKILFINIFGNVKMLKFFIIDIFSLNGIVFVAFLKLQMSLLKTEKEVTHIFYH